MSTQVPKLYSSWSCPFAQRVWIALLEKNIQFEYVEVNPYNKTEEWLAISPRGLVPTLVHEGKSIFESGICIEYIDEAWPDNPPKFLPGGPYERAKQRIWVDHVMKKVTPPFYHFLMKGNEEGKNKLMGSLGEMFQNMDPVGPFFVGSNMTFVDLMLIPFALRFEILDHYRGFKLDEEKMWSRYKIWYEAVKSCPSVTKTMPGRQHLIEIYRRYAENTAQSQVAEAIRKGTGLP